MKKITLILAFFFVTGIASAQRTNLNNAFNNLRKGNIEKAKNFIDLASEHDDTKDGASTWFYKGCIYLSVAVNEDAEISSLDPDALNKAYEYFNKAITIDKDVYNDMLSISTPERGIKIIGLEFANRGTKAYNAGDYYNAYLYFDKANTLSPSDLIKYNAATSGYYYEQNRIAKRDTVSPNLSKDVKKHLVQLTGKSSPNENAYNFLANIYMTENDTLKAIAVANKAETVFPDSVNTLLLKASVLYWADKASDAKPALDKVKSMAPNDSKVFQNIGYMLEKVSFEESEAAYKKSIELDPTNYNTKFNLGALYFNKFIAIKKVASNLKTNQQAEYDSLMIQSNHYIDLALPIVESCYKETPKAFDIVYMLKQIYANLKQIDKANEMDAVLKSLKK